MSFEATIGLGVLFALAFGNGANDVGKNVASLMTDPKTAVFRPRYRPLVWGGLFSGFGSVSAILIAGRLFSVFTPQSFLRTTPGLSFILAALAGAAAWVILGTVVRVPVSTTHAIVGAIVLQAAFIFGVSQLDWSFLALRVLLPLAAGPFAALVGVFILDRLFRNRLASQKEGSRRLAIATWGSAAATSYARGVNDAPKMAALGVFFLIGTTGDVGWLPYVIISLAVVVGALVWGDRVAKTLITRASPLERGQRLKADAATAALVSAGAYLGDPFSTTQVSAGASAGVGGRERQALRSTLRGMILAWAVTLPAAGLLAITTSFFAAALLT